MNSGFLISVSSDFDELWRYNITLVCQCLDADGEQVDFCAERSEVAEVGANLSEAPKGFANRREVKLSTPPCDKIEAICYLIRHSALQSRVVTECAPFSLRIKIERRGEVLYDETHKVNQWPGASIHLKA